MVAVNSTAPVVARHNRGRSVGVGDDPLVVVAADDADLSCDLTRRQVSSIGGSIFGHVAFFVSHVTVGELPKEMI